MVNNLLFDNNVPSVLDLSAAFDTVDHTKLLDILFNDIDAVNIAHQWSFLTGRTQKVKIGNSYSDETKVLYGSVPILFNIYIRSLYKYLELKFGTCILFGVWNTKMRFIFNFFNL